MATATHPHAEGLAQMEVSEESEPEEDLPPVQMQNEQARKITKILECKKLNCKALSKISMAPLVLAKAVSDVKRISSSVRRNFNAMMDFLSFRWNERQKVIFLKNVTDNERFCGPAKIISHLKMRDADPRLMLSITHDLTILCLKEQPTQARSLMQLIGEIYGQGEVRKLEVFKQSDFYSTARARYFLEAADENNLAAHASILMSLISRISRNISLS